MGYAVEVENVVKRFGEVEVIHGIDLAIENGEFIVLVGPSGCGKSTLLRMIAGLEEITDGIVKIAERTVNDVDPRDRDVAMVFQNYALYPHMDVARNMGFGLKLRKVPKDEIERKINDVSGILGLREYLSRLPRQLSGGQRQRVAMGRAIVRDPLVFLFDEPLSNLDAKLRSQMRVEIKALHERLRNTIVYVTHDQMEAMTMADRIVVLNDGHIAQVGSPLELYDRPQNTFVAQFIGSPAMNFLRGAALPSSGGYVLKFNGQSLALPAEAKVRDGENLIIGVRPEHFVFADDGIECRVKITEPLGREILVYGDVSGNDVCVATPERHALESGQTVRLKPTPGNVHVFDAESGERV